MDTPRHARTILDYDETDLTGPNFVDHFSLREPSSTVKFRGARMHVYETTNEQIVLEDRVSSKDAFGEKIDDESLKTQGRRHNITVKRVHFANFGLFFLRMLYTLVSLLLFGFLFALSFQSILFVFIKLATDSRTAAENQDSFAIIKVVASLFSAPMFLYGFSSLMAIATTFVMEAWSGGNLFRSVIGFPEAVREALYCVLLLFLPALTLVGSFFARFDNAWEYACYAWFMGVTFLFCIFAFAIVWVEVCTCFRLISIHFCNSREDRRDGKFLRNVARAVLITQRRKYSGEQHEQYLVTGDDRAPEGGYTFGDKKPTLISKSLYTRITELSCFRFMFEKIPSKRIYSLEEVLDVMPFLTDQTWSLETMFCIRNRNRKIVTAKGPSALKSSQMMSSFTCNIIGSVILILLFVALLFWLETGFKTYILVGVVSIIFCLYPMIKSNITMLHMYRDVNKDKITVDCLEAGGDGEATQPKTNSEETEETIFFKVWETTRITQAKDWLCYTSLALEHILFFWFPLICFLAIGNYPVAVVFFTVASFSLLRQTFGASAIISEVGPLNQTQIERNPGLPEERRLFKRRATLVGVQKTLVKKSRFAEIIGNVSKRDATRHWMCIFGALTIGFFFLFVLAVQSGDGYVERPPIILVNDYSYPKEDSLQYPSCSLSKGFSLGGVDIADRENILLDHSFFSLLSYEKPTVTNYTLAQFFGEGQVVDETELVKEYRENKGNSKIDIAFKFFTSPEMPEVGIVAIRGSQTMIDWLNNLKLWSGPGLAQLVKWATPYGWIWTPILDDLVKFLSWVEASELESASYYTVSTEFLNDLKDDYSVLTVTGASLGGGLAIISGAQARVPAVAISGLGAELIRNVVVPNIDMDDINKYTFNFIPDRDIIARIGGRPRQHQEAACSASVPDSLMGCHSMFRSFCEISYRCGSVDRPVLCDCHFRFGYPEPEPIGNTTRSFQDACKEQQRAFLDATGSTKTAIWL